MEYMKGIDGLYIQEEPLHLENLMACTEGIRSFCPAFWKKRT